MQKQTPIPRKGKKKSVKHKRTSLGGNNPWQNVQPQTNNLPGFNFPGAVY